MNPCIQQLAEEAAEQAVFDDLELCMITEADSGLRLQVPAAFVQRFAEALVAKVLDEVNERAYYSGDRVWSDELDRPWVELEFGMGKLAKNLTREE